MRTSHIILVLLLLSFASEAADGPVAPYLGKPIAQVIDEFRAAGHPFAYSTNLVNENMLVTIEPDAVEPVQLVDQFLRPHGLMIRSESGVHLVVRSARSELPRGNILLVVRTKGSDIPIVSPQVASSPALSSSSLLLPGIYEYSGVSPGRYNFDVNAIGYERVSRIVNVKSGKTTVVNIGMDIAKSEIETIGVSASRYEISRDIATSQYSIDQRTIQSMPDLGEDPIRVTQRLPGAAASGASAKTHFRGGEPGEIGIMLNGHFLLDPFHVRDFQSIFSTVDSRAIEGVEVYTGGFPVRFGDRMSGLVLMETLESVQPRHTELGVSVFNTSVLTTGRSADQRWLFSARRGNLDLIIDSEYGRPSYYDIFGEYEYDFSPDTTLSVNALYADDKVQVILEAEPEEFEEVISKTQNTHVWIELENRWSRDLSSSMVLAATSYTNLRKGSLNDLNKFVASVRDQRNIKQYAFRQDFVWNRSESHLVQWGLNVLYGEAIYDYMNEAEYYGLQALYQDQPESASYAHAAQHDGASYALYFSDRWKPTRRTAIEWGLRWDDQTYTGLSDSQLSPRISVMHAVTPKTELRFSWGRYHQSQGIHELQIEDGITNYWPAQSADHVIAGVRHLFHDNYALRAEVFYKDMRDVRPRFENLYDPLGLIPEIQPDRVMLAPASAKSAGLEISIDRSTGPMTWWASYTLAESTDRINGKDESRSWDQTHAIQGGISWTNKKWDVSVATSVHSGWPSTTLSLVEDGVDDDGEPVLVAIPGPRNVNQHRTFAAVDFRISRKFDVRRGSLTTFLEVSNATNRSNECCLDYDFEEDETTGEEVFEKSLDYWMPLVPAIGVLWEF